jgi:hypothetical protein
LPDDTVQATHVFINPAGLAEGSTGCLSLATRLLHTLTPGKRRLDLAAGDRALGKALTVRVPQGFTVLEQPGPDFDVYFVLGVRELAPQSPQLVIYSGYHPDYESDKAARKVPARILGRDMTWEAKMQEGVFVRQALVPLGEGFLHLSLGGPTEADAQELAQVAESLKEAARATR